jgi:rhodanese-related sulfurtransferase
MLDTIKNMLGFGPAVDYAQLVKEGAIILDVRSKGEFAGGHIKGAVNIPVDALSAKFGTVERQKQNHYHLLCFRHAQRFCKKYFTIKRLHVCTQWWRMGKLKQQIIMLKQIINSHWDVMRWIRLIAGVGFIISGFHATRYNHRIVWRYFSYTSFI